MLLHETACDDSSKSASSRIIQFFPALPLESNEIVEILSQRVALIAKYETAVLAVGGGLADPGYQFDYRREFGKLQDNSELPQNNIVLSIWEDWEFEHSTQQVVPENQIKKIDISPYLSHSKWQENAHVIEQRYSNGQVALRDYLDSTGAHIGTEYFRADGVKERFVLCILPNPDVCSADIHFDDKGYVRFADFTDTTGAHRFIHYRKDGTVWAVVEDAEKNTKKYIYLDGLTGEAEETTCTGMRRRWVDTLLRSAMNVGNGPAIALADTPADYRLLREAKYYENVKGIFTIHESHLSPDGKLQWWAENLFESDRGVVKELACFTQAQHDVLLRDIKRNNRAVLSIVPDLVSDVPCSESQSADKLSPAQWTPNLYEKKWCDSLSLHFDEDARTELSSTNAPSDKPLRVWWGKGCPNMGDYINDTIYSDLYGLRTVFSKTTKADLMGIGSTMQKIMCQKEEYSSIVNTNVQDRPVHVWGTGCIEDYCADEWRMKRPTIFHAVRGVHTRNFLSEVLQKELGCVLGDPGLLVSTYIKPQEKKYRLGIVPHYIDYNHPSVQRLAEAVPNSIVIDVRKDPKDCIRLISQCETILSSSLHGLVFADAYNIPARWCEMSDRVIGRGFKFHDYYSSYGISGITPVDLREGIQSCPMPDDIEKEAIFTEKIILDRQQELFDAFPQQYFC